MVQMEKTGQQAWVAAGSRVERWGGPQQVAEELGWQWGRGGQDGGTEAVEGGGLEEMEEKEVEDGGGGGGQGEGAGGGEGSRVEWMHEALGRRAV